MCLEWILTLKFAEGQGTPGLVDVGLNLAVAI